MHPALQSALARSRAVKIISGLNNFDAKQVTAVVRAAEQGGATFVDIAAAPDLVRMVRQQIQLPICVSAVDPERFVAAVAAGADLIEIGNFDSFYQRGRYFSAAEVLTLTHQTRALLPQIPLSVTVPHTLELDQQVQLAIELVRAGADIIQTEGGTASSPQHPGTLGLIEKATPTLAAAYEISREVSIPVLCASGLSSVTVPLAIAAGASGVGIGSAVNRLNSEVAMVAAVRSIVDVLTPTQAVLAHD
jgi:thiamine monophosphate synthase